MSDISYVSQANKNVLQSSYDLNALINRVTQLSNEQKKYDNQNDLTHRKVSKISKLKQDHQEDLEKIKKNMLNRQESIEEKHKLIQQARGEVKFQKDDLFKAIKDMRSKEYVAIKKQQMVAESRMKDLKDIELQKRREQALCVQDWKNKQKLHIASFWDQRVIQQKEQQGETKDRLMVQALMQSQAIEKLEIIELELINKLKQSQLVNKQLQQQLEKVLTLPHQEYQDIYPTAMGEQSTNSTSFKQAQHKFANESPYIAIPKVQRSQKVFRQPLDTEDLIPTKDQIMPSSKMSAKLPQLKKPKLREQQQLVDRLFNSKKESVNKVAIKGKDNKYPQPKKVIYNKQNLQFHKIVIINLNILKDHQKIKKNDEDIRITSLDYNQKAYIDNDEYNQDSGFENASPQVQENDYEKDQEKPYEQEQEYEEEEAFEEEKQEVKEQEQEEVYDDQYDD